MRGTRAAIKDVLSEDEAERFWHETDLVGLTPAEQEERKLASTIVLKHPVHLGLPPVLSGLKAIVALV